MAAYGLLHPALLPQLAVNHVLIMFAVPAGIHFAGFRDGRKVKNSYRESRLCALEPL